MRSGIAGNRPWMTATASRGRLARMIGEATLADAILDRIVHNAHRITYEVHAKAKNAQHLTDGEITEINHL